MIHAFTVDVEDWFNGIPVAGEVKRGAERRLRIGIDILLRLMNDARVHGTFFFLGPVARDYPDLVRLIDREGHEIGSHGWSHDLLYEMTIERFRDETRRATDAISETTGKPVTAYRAACFSITRDSFWALDALAAMGFRYDSSVFPVRNWRYGIAGFDPYPQRLTTAEGTILEFPISIRRFLGKDVPISGGAYFRLYPYSVTRANFRFAEKNHIPVVFYVHPWELDPDHPRVDFHWKPRLTHYANLKYTQRRLGRLLTDFAFKPLGEVLEDEINRRSL